MKLVHLLGEINQVKPKQYKGQSFILKVKDNQDLKKIDKLGLILGPKPSVPK